MAVNGKCATNGKCCTYARYGNATAKKQQQQQQLHTLKHAQQQQKCSAYLANLITNSCAARSSMLHTYLERVVASSVQGAHKGVTYLHTDEL